MSTSYVQELAQWFPVDLAKLIDDFAEPTLIKLEEGERKRLWPTIWAEGALWFLDVDKQERKSTGVLSIRLFSWNEVTARWDLRGEVTDDSSQTMARRKVNGLPFGNVSLQKVNDLAFGLVEKSQSPKIWMVDRFYKFLCLWFIPKRHQSLQQQQQKKVRGQISYPFEKIKDAEFSHIDRYLFAQKSTLFMVMLYPWGASIRGIPLESSAPGEFFKMFNSVTFRDALTSACPVPCNVAAIQHDILSLSHADYLSWNVYTLGKFQIGSDNEWTGRPISIKIDELFDNKILKIEPKVSEPRLVNASENSRRIDRRDLIKSWETIYFHHLSSVSGIPQTWRGAEFIADPPHSRKQRRMKERQRMREARKDLERMKERQRMKEARQDLESFYNSIKQTEKENSSNYGENRLGGGEEEEEEQQQQPRKRKLKNLTQVQAKAKSKQTSE